MFLKMFGFITDITYHEDRKVYVDEKVTLHCTSPTPTPSSVTWRYRSNSASHDSILWRIDGDQMSQVDTSGRLSLNTTDSNASFHLVIHNVLQADSGIYLCSIDAGHEKQHVTVLNVGGIENMRFLSLYGIRISLSKHLRSVFHYPKRTTLATYPIYKFA